MTMKKKSRKFGFWVALALSGAVIASLEVFDLHPEFSVGRFHSLWVGFRHMDTHFEAGTMITMRGGKKVIHRDYHLGPVQIDLEH